MAKSARMKDRVARLLRMLTSRGGVTVKTISLYDIVDTVSSGMSAAHLHILLALSEGKRHGYAIGEEVTELSSGRVRLGPASLYGNLQRLLDTGWIEEVDAPRNVDERRRYYQLTRAGRMAIDEELKQMETTLRKARARRTTPAPSKS